MALCLNEQSVKIFAEYFNRKLNTDILTDDITYNELIYKLFQDTVKEFEGKKTTESGLTVEQIVLHHMLVIPMILPSYLSRPGVNISGRENLLNESLKQQGNVETAFAEDVEEGVLERVLEDYANMVVGVMPFITISGVPVDIESTSLPTFRAVNWSFDTFKGVYTLRLKNEDGSFKSNIDNPKYKYQIAIIRNVIGNNKAKNYRLKLVQKKDIKKLDGFVNEVITEKGKERIYPAQDNTPLLVLVNSENEIVRFDEFGNENMDGFIVGFEINKTPSDIGLDRKMTYLPLYDPIKGAPTLAKGANPNTVRKYEYLIEEGFTSDQAKDIILKEGIAYINNIKNAIERLMNNEEVYFDIDASRSSPGFVERKATSRTNLNTIRNWALGLSIDIDTTGTRTIPVLKIPGTNDPIPIQSRDLESLQESSPEQFDFLIRLLTDNTLKSDNITLLDKDMRENLINVYMQTRAASKEHLYGIEIVWNIQKPNEIAQIYLNGKKYTISASTVNEQTRAKRAETFKAAFIEHISQFKSFVYNTSGTFNYTIVNSINNITASGQVYKDGDIYMLAKKPPLSFHLERRHDVTDTFPVITSIDENNVISTTQKKYEDHIKDYGYTDAVPNSLGELAGRSPYMAFIMVDQATDENYQDAQDEVFLSVADLNRLQETLLAGEEEAVMDWLEESGWNDVGAGKNKLKILFNQPTHTYGKKVLASFMKDTIMLYKGSNKTAVYHEIFHVWMDAILTKEEKAQVLQEVRDEYGEQKFTVTVRGIERTVKFSEATDLEIEEWLAEEFRSYARNRSIYNRKEKAKSWVRKMFDRLIEVINKFIGKKSLAELTIFGTNSSQLQQYFNDIYTGNVNFSNFTPLTATEEKWHSYELDKSIDLTAQEVAIAIDSMKVLMAMFAEKAVSKTASPQQNIELANLRAEQVKYKSTDQEYKDIGAKINKLYNINNEIGSGVFLLEQNPFLFRKALEYVYNAFKNKFENVTDEDTKKLFQRILDNFGDINAPIESYIDNKTKSLLALFLSKHTTINLSGEILDQRVVLEDEIEDAKIANLEFLFGKEGSEFDIADTIDEKTKELLSSLWAYDNGGTGTVIKNLLGFPEATPFRIALHKVLRHTDGNITREQMYQSIKKAGEDHDFKSKDRVMEQLAKRLGNPAKATTIDEQIMWARFWHSIAKHTIRLRTLTFEKEDTVTERDILGDPINGTAKIIAKSGRSKLTAVNIISNWSNNFRYASQNTTNPELFYKDVSTGKKARELDIVKLVNYFSQDVYAPLSYREFTGIELYFEQPKEGYGKIIKRYQADPAELLRALGIEIPSNILTRQDLIKGSEGTQDRRIDPEFISLLFKNLMKLAEYEKTNKIKTLSSLRAVFKGFKIGTETYNDLTTYLDRLAYYASEYNDQYLTFSSWTPEGKRQSEKSFHSSTTVLLSHLNDDNIKTYKELVAIEGLEHLDYKINPIIAANGTFRAMWRLYLDESDPNYGKRDERIKFTFENVVGSVVSYEGLENGVKSIKSDPLTKFNTEFHHTLMGRTELLRMEAKSSSYTMNTPIMKNGRIYTDMAIPVDEIDSIYKDDYSQKGVNAATILYEQFAPYIEAELVRMAKIKSIKNRIEKGAKFQFDAAYLNRGNDFLIFELLLTDEIKQELMNLLDEDLIHDSFTINNLLSDKLKEKIEDSIKTYFAIRANQLEKEYKDLAIISDDIIEKYRQENETLETLETRLYRAVAVNSYLNYLNFTSLFLGDPGIYDYAGENFHKRIAGVVSTGTIMLADKSWYNFVNSNEFEKDGFAKKYFAEMSSERKEVLTNLGRSITYNRSNYKGYLTTGIMKEAVIASAYLKQYVERLGISNKDKYEKMEIADGSAWISMDAYRLLALSSDEWSKKQEDVYQKLLANEPLDENDLKASFPIKKYQYYGPLFNESGGIGLTAMAFHKYSLVPLIPNVIQEKPLQELHQRMMEEGIDYVGMESISKLSTIKDITLDAQNNFEGIDNIIYDLDNNGIITDNAIVKNKIHVKYLKSQVHIEAGFKEKITLFSQMRKLVYTGLFNNGTPIDFLSEEKDDVKRKTEWKELEKEYKEGKRTLDEIKNITVYGHWSLRYEDVIADFQQELLNQLLEDLGISKTSVKGDKSAFKYVGNKEKLKTFIQNELRNKNLLPAEVNSIIDQGTGELISDLSLSLHSSTIEEILVSVVDKKLRAIKVNGEGFIQQSGAMMEDPQFRLDMELQNQGSLGLRTYAGLDANGNLITNEDVDVEIDRIQFMDVKIAMQGDFKNLIYLQWNGEEIAVYTKTVDKNGKEKSILDFEASRLRLNEAIKDNEWFEKHKQFLTLTGPRIPTQALASLEAAYVREFLSPLADKTIILPAEIVAKTGSDFDIDKLYLMYPNIARYGNSVEIIQRKKSSKTRLELKADIDELEENVEKIQVELNEAYKIKTDVYIALKTAQKLDIKEVNDLQEQIKNEWDAWNYYQELAKKIWQRAVDGEITYTEAQELHRKQTTPGTQKHKNTAEALQKELDALILEEFEKLSDVYVEEGQTLEQVYNSEMKSNVDYITNLENKLKLAQEKYYNARRTFDSAGTKGIENQLIDLFTERIGFPQSLKQLVEPNSTSFFDELATKLKNQLNENRKNQGLYFKLNAGLDTKGSRDKISASTAFDLQFNLMKHQENTVGMEALGIAAVVSVFYAMFTKMGATLNGVTLADQKEFKEGLELWKRNYSKNDLSDNEKLEMNRILGLYQSRTIKFPHNNVRYDDETLKLKKDGISLSFIENVEGINIQDVIGQLINGFVDVAKKPWVFDIQGSMQNVSQLLFLIMAGVTVENAVNFSSIPMIVEYNQIKARLEGTTASLNKEWGINPIKSKSEILRDARATMFAKYEKLLQDNYGYTNSREYNLFGNAFQFSKTPEQANKLFEGFQKNKERTFDEFLAFAHYLQIEDMSKDVTDFTMATKFDTQKIKNISDAEARIQLIEKNIASTTTVVPANWYSMYNETIVGLMNNDKFIINLFSGYFGLRNNIFLLRKSAKIQRADDEKGKDLSVLRKRFKDLWINFLFQNSIYSPTSYTPHNYTSTFTIRENYDLATDISINVLENIVEYNKEHIEIEKEKFAKYFKNRNIKDFFPTTLHYVRFKIEYNKIQEEWLGKSDKDLALPYYYIFNTSLSSNPTYTKGFSQVKLAMYRSNNNVAMFDSDFGYASILKNILIQYPELMKKFYLLRDMMYPGDEQLNISNLALPSLTDPDLVMMYKGNLIQLQADGRTEVSDFFTKFETFAFLQTGVERGSIYDLARINSNSLLFADYVRDGIGSLALQNELDDLSKKLSKGKIKIEEADNIIFSHFESIYARLIQQNENGVKLINKRTRGISLISEGLDKKAKATVRKFEGTNITVHNFFEVGRLELSDDVARIDDGSDFFTIDLNNIDYDYLKSLANKAEVQILSGVKFDAPRPEQQEELDIALKEYLSIDNTGLYAVPLTQTISTGNNVSINNAKIEPFFAQTKSRDLTLSQNATKAIAESIDAIGFKVNITMQYLEAIDSEKVGKGRKKFYSDEDKVWIFGALNIQQEQTGLTKDELNKIIENQFESYYKVQINKAIKEGVKSFYVAANRGISELAQKYLSEKGYYGIPRYSTEGKYFEFVPTTQPQGGVTSEITKSNYTRAKVKADPNTAYVFTENTHSITAFPNRQGGGSAIIRPEANAFAIVTKKKYDYNTRENVDYSDTEADFKEFTEVNTRLINELKNSGKSKIIFPQGFASDKAKLPTRFAEWLQKELLDAFGLVTELNANKTGLISKSVQSTTQPQAGVEVVDEISNIKIGATVTRIVEKEWGGNLPIKNIIDVILKSEKVKAFNKMTSAEFQSNGYKQIKEIMLQAFKNFQTTDVQAADTFKEIMESIKGNPISLSDTFTNKTYAAIETILMEWRDKYVALKETKEASKARNQNIIKSDYGGMIKDRTIKGFVKLYPFKATDFTDIGDYYKAMKEFSIKNGSFYILRDKFKKFHFGNPFTSKEGTANAKVDGVTVVRQFATTREATIAYALWLDGKLVNKDGSPIYPQLEERREWINIQINSGALKGKPIYYPVERFQDSHANVLDYFINREPLTEKTMEGFKPCG